VNIQWVSITDEDPGKGKQVYPFSWGLPGVCLGFACWSGKYAIGLADLEIL
jgi:hypothetical protein